MTSRAPKVNRFQVQAISAYPAVITGARKRKAVAPFRTLPLRERQGLLQKLLHGLLRLVGLRQGRHSGLLEDVLLRHLRDRLADVSVLNVVLRAGQVGDLGVFDV